MATSKTSKRRARKKNRHGRRLIQHNNQRRREGRSRPKKYRSRKRIRGTALSSLFRRGGMRFGRTILRNVNRDRFLFRKLQDQGIESEESVEYIILQLLFEARVLTDWNVTDDLVDVFLYIKAKLDWAGDIPVIILIQLLQAVLRARLNYHKKPALPHVHHDHCAAATRADKLVKWIGGVDHLMEELETFVQLTLPVAQVLDKMTFKKSKQKLVSADDEGDDELVFRNGLCVNAADFDVNTRRHRHPIMPPRSLIIVPQLQWHVPAKDEDVEMPQDSQDHQQETGAVTEESGHVVSRPLARASIIVPTGFLASHGGHPVA